MDTLGSVSVINLHRFSIDLFSQKSNQQHTNKRTYNLQKQAEEIYFKDHLVKGKLAKKNDKTIDSLFALPSSGSLCMVISCACFLPKTFSYLRFEPFHLLDNEQLRYVLRLPIYITYH